MLSSQINLSASSKKNNLTIQAYFLKLVADVKLAPFTTILIQDVCNLNLKMEVCIFFF